MISDEFSGNKSVKFGDDPLVLAKCTHQEFPNYFFVINILVIRTHNMLRAGRSQKTSIINMAML